MKHADPEWRIADIGLIGLINLSELLPDRQIRTMEEINRYAGDSGIRSTQNRGIKSFAANDSGSLLLTSIQKRGAETVSGWPTAGISGIERSRFISIFGTTVGGTTVSG